ncbi:general substrate transporter [Achaetomium macrosporum]|uniref:General substrate transporter n=1 Tax=Achaetomium macrosporum TaxID=79813 RepID=A0AAN7C1C0_9PEZI|nr:general substrate transporter [Achaetomium macrosporum]
MFSNFRGTTPTGVWCMCLVSAGAFLFGFDNGWRGTIQGAEAFLRDFGSCEIVDGKQTCNISTPQRSAGSSVQSAGIMIGNLIAIYINKSLGRRLSLVVTGLISICGVLLELTIRRWQTVASVAMGLAANIVPIYLSETSTKAARGSTINMYQNVQIIGFVVAGGVVFASVQRNDPAAYLIPLGVQLLAPSIMVTLSPLLPESPTWLMRKGRVEEAVVSANRLFGTPDDGFDGRSYIREIEVPIEVNRANPQSSNWRDAFRGPSLRRLLVAVGIQCFLQAQGSSYIVNYMVPFLNDIGVTYVFPWIVGLSCTYYAGILTGHVLPDKYGRRPVIICSTLVSAVFMIIISALVTAVSPVTSQSGAACVAFLFLWQAATGVMSPLIWIICTDAAPTRNREKVLSLAIFVSFGVSLLIASVSPYIQDSGYGNLGGRIGAFSVVTSIWAFFRVPETKGLSLEELDFLYGKSVPARESRKYKFASSIAPEKEVVDADLEDRENKAQLSVERIN